MKEIRETKFIEQTTITFVADDGTVFEKESDCKTYERRQNEEKCKKDFEALNPQELDFPFSDWGAECNIYKVHLSDKKDLVKVVDYEMCCGGSYFDEYISEKTFNYPCDVIFYSSDCFLDCVDDISVIVSRLEKALLDLKA